MQKLNLTNGFIPCPMCDRDAQIYDIDTKGCCKKCQEIGDLDYDFKEWLNEDMDDSNPDD